MTDEASIAVITPVLLEVVPVIVAPTSIDVMSDRLKVAFVNTADTSTVALANIVAMSIVAPFP